MSWQQRMTQIIQGMTPQQGRPGAQQQGMQQGMQQTQQQAPQGAPAPAPGPNPENDPFGTGVLFSKQNAAVPANPTQQQQAPQPQPVPANGGVPPQSPEYNGYLSPWNAQQMQAAMSQQDFMRGLNPELTTKLMGGDMSVLGDIINHAVRNATMGTLQTAHSWVDRGVSSGLEKFQGGLDDRFRDYEIRNQNVDDPILSHPQVAPVFQTITQFIASQNPGMRPNEVQAQAKKWFSGLNELQTQQTQQTQQANQQPAPSDGTNWLKSLGLPQQPSASQGQQQAAPQGQSQQQSWGAQ